ncbi:cytochrome c3 family protein [uncultured Desulfobacter sp.]|uniref:cytochrome c3 family protein n=1 Tax=uncultured Desulfobacter sp. TaxID=240139 RepID=UPI0029F510C4|nr:cytochrome c3 family protein [uncultured Desulfobacter sp.]
MSKKLFTILLAAGIALIFTASGIQAGTEVGDVVTMKSKLLDAKRKKGPDAKKPCKLVEFTHKKHIEEYKLSCGDCHHDKDGKPLADLKMGNDVQKCEACHTHAKAKKADKTFQGKYKKKPVDIMHLESAIHENCIGCHKEKGLKVGTKCGDCHKKM